MLPVGNAVHIPASSCSMSFFLRASAPLLILVVFIFQSRWHSLHQMNSSAQNKLWQRKPIFNWLSSQWPENLINHSSLQLKNMRKSWQTELCREKSTFWWIRYFWKYERILEVLWWNLQRNSQGSCHMLSHLGEIMQCFLCLSHLEHPVSQSLDFLVLVLLHLNSAQLY